MYRLKFFICIYSSNFSTWSPCSPCNEDIFAWERTPTYHSEQILLACLSFSCFPSWLGSAEPRICGIRYLDHVIIKLLTSWMIVRKDLMYNTQICGATWCKGHNPVERRLLSGSFSRFSPPHSLFPSYSSPRLPPIQPSVLGLTPIWQGMFFQNHNFHHKVHHSKMLQYRPSSLLRTLE